MSDTVARVSIAILLVLLLAFTAVLGLVGVRVVRLQQRVDTLSGELATAEGEIAKLEEEVADAGSDDPLSGLLEGGSEGGDSSGLLDGLLESLGGGDASELLEGLGGGAEGSARPLSGADPARLAACVAGTEGGEGLGGLGALGSMGSEPITSDEVSEQIDEVAGRVAELRELPALELDPELLTGAEIGERISQLVDEEYPVGEADLDARILSALGAVPADADLLELQKELLSEQVAGFYDTDTQELVVRADESQLGPVQLATLAHEVEHAIADGELGLDVDEERDADAETAALAVVEGDATLTQQRFATQAFSLTDQLAIAQDPAVVESQQQLEQVPAYLADTLTFPYLEGLSFVCDRYDEGGWAAVDEAYAARPTTTLEILFPDRYPYAPVTPAPRGDPGGGWVEARADTFGAADLLALFSAPGDDRAVALDMPRERAGAWAGGALRLFTRGEESALGVALSASDATLLCDSMAAWYEAAFPEAEATSSDGLRLSADGDVQDAALVCNGADVRLGIAPDLATARALTSG